jgi:DnaD/phage-associated family protein
METDITAIESTMRGNQRFSITPALAVEDKTLSDSVYRTLSCLGVFGDKQGWCWPTLEILAEMRGVSKPRISQDIKILKEKGYIQVERKQRGGMWANNKYRIMFDTHELTPEVNSELTTEINSELTPEVNSELTTEINSELTPEVNSELTTEINSELTPEVNLTPQLTPQLNAPLNHHDELITEVNSEAVGKVCTLYTQNIGAIASPIMAQELIDMAKAYTYDWIEEAFTIAIKNNARNLAYIEKILLNWLLHGRNWKPGRTGNSTEKAGPLGI